MNMTKAKSPLRESLKNHPTLYLLMLIPFAYIIIFQYVPMYGLLIAFKNYSPRKGILGSPWIGFKNFELFIKSYQFKRVVLNTLGLRFYLLLASFPFPVLLALSLNEVRNQKYKKTVQMISYLPHFISTVVVVGILNQFLSYNGLLNNIRIMMGLERISLLNMPELFKTLYVLSDIWQTVGYSSIIYLAALSAVNVDLYDAGRIDGMNIFKKILYIDIPTILPTIIILFILNVSKIMNVGFEKVFLMQNNLNMATSDVINTYVYRIGILTGSYSFATAVGLFTSIINSIILITVNKISKTISETSLW